MSQQVLDGDPVVVGGRSWPSSSRAGVVSGNVPSAASACTTTAVNPFDPLAVAILVSTVIGTCAARRPVTLVPRLPCPVT